MSYTVQPGLYAVGEPDGSSPVLVTANYKLSFDHLRRHLHGRDAWLMVLNTNGVNVWCAAGKGTFGTDELVRKVEQSCLADLLEHRTLVVPQLGATGVSAYQVKERCGFRVVYGPVRAEDVPAFLDSGMQATQEMRRVRFNLQDRLVLVPVEIVGNLKYVLVAALGLLLLAGLGEGGYAWGRVGRHGLRAAVLMLGGFAAGTALVPALLPWLPGRPFSLKGAFVGVSFGVALVAYHTFRPGLFPNALAAGSWVFMLTAMVSFFGMLFTGSSTYTSLSGVRREMRIAVPMQLTAAIVGVAMFVAARFA